MGVDYYGCANCGDGVYEEYIHHCEECGKSIGTCCVVNDDVGDRYAHAYKIKYDGFDEQKAKYGIKEDWIEKGWVTIGEPMDDVGIDPKYCPFCGGGKVDDGDLLAFAIKKLNTTKDQLTDEYKEAK